MVDGQSSLTRGHLRRDLDGEVLLRDVLRGMLRGILGVEGPVVKDRAEPLAVVTWGVEAVANRDDYGNLTRAREGVLRKDDEHDRNIESVQAHAPGD